MRAQKLPQSLFIYLFLFFHLDFQKKAPKVQKILVGGGAKSPLEKTQIKADFFVECPLAQASRLV